jgi:type III pantothenate kinase
MTNFFVIDVGNTSTKWGVSDGKKISKEKEFPTKLFTQPFLKIKNLGFSNSSGAIISCVVPKAIPGIKSYLKSLGVRRPILVSSKIDLGIGISYPNPSKIGADRLANAVAAVELYGAPAIVVDFGTAVTFDVISAKAEYIGGAIAPGLRFMTHYLHERAALLPYISLSEPRSTIGKNTVEAMRVGAVIGYRGLVKEILSGIQREMKINSKDIQIIATGGHCSLVASKIPEIHHIVPKLTLEGLRLIYDRNTKSD